MSCALNKVTSELFLQDMSTEAGGANHVTRGLEPSVSHHLLHRGERAVDLSSLATGQRCNLPCLGDEASINIAKGWDSGGFQVQVQVPGEGRPWRGHGSSAPFPHHWPCASLLSACS